MYKLRFRVQMNYEAIMQLTELFSFFVWSGVGYPVTKVADLNIWTRTEYVEQSISKICIVSCFFIFNRDIWKYLDR